MVTYILRRLGEKKKISLDVAKAYYKAVFAVERNLKYKEDVDAELVTSGDDDIIN